MTVAPNMHSREDSAAAAPFCIVQWITVYDARWVFYFLTFRHLSIEIEHESCECHDVEMDGMSYIHIPPLE